MLLSLPLLSCSFNFITISLNGSRKINRDKDTGEFELQKSFLDDYAQHESKIPDTQQPSNSSPMTDWTEFACSLSPHTFLETATWIRTHEQTSHPLHQADIVDIATLNSKQRLAYDIISDHHHTLTTQNQEPPPLHMIVCGTAGTGKSYLINAISHCTTGKCILSAATGVAAFNMWPNSSLSTATSSLSFKSCIFCRLNTVN